ncbi:MAG: hypothetical protein FWF47_03495 [Clostridia bacterium]|nr:hypothetical protein [Clostridia bacterium]
MKNDFEHQLDKIRIEIYEQTKDMKNAEAVKIANDYGKALAAKYGFKYIKGNPGIPMNNANTL